MWKPRYPERRDLLTDLVFLPCLLLLGSRGARPKISPTSLVSRFSRSTTRREIDISRDIRRVSRLKSVKRTLFRVEIREKSVVSSPLVKTNIAIGRAVNAWLTVCGLACRV